MIKGCKHYFSMFGMMLWSVNVSIQKTFNQVYQQIKKSIAAEIKLNHIQQYFTLQKNQTYQG